MSVLLARWLTPDQYGVFALAFSVFLLLTVLYQAIVLEPMSVYGGPMAVETLGGYIKTLFWIHGAFSIAVGLVLAISAVITSGLHMPTLPSAFAGLALAAPLILLLGLARRTYYIRLSPGPAVAGACLYSLVIITGLAALRTRLSPFLAFGLMGVAALVSSLFLLLRLGRYLDWKSQATTLRATWHDHWQYGRWAMVSAVLAWAPAYLCYPLIVSFRGMAGAADLKALMNISAPVIQTFMALSVLILPYAASSQQNGKDGMAMCRRIVFVFVAAGLAYWVVMMSIRTVAFRVMYTGKYTEIMHLLPLLVIESLVWSVSCGPTIVLRAMKSPKSVCAANFVATLIFVAVGIPATRAFGISGVISAIILADISILVVAFWSLRRMLSAADGARLYNMRQETEVAS